MNLFRLLKSSLYYYRWKNLSMMAGIAISTAVITGSLIVGDSVKFSLKKIVDRRLGDISFVVRSGDRYFTAGLADSLSFHTGITAVPVLQTGGQAVVDGGSIRIGNIQVLGVSEEMDKIAGTTGFYSGLAADEVILSQNLAARLSIQAGDEILLRLTRASLIPSNAPFVSDQGNIISERFRVKAVAGYDQLGMFNLENSQTAPHNAFISLESMCRIMELDSRANMILVEGGKSMNAENLMRILEQCLRPEDAGLYLEKNPDENLWNLKSKRVFIDKTISSGLLDATPPAEPFLCYFVNFISRGERKTPYSFVAGIPGQNIENNEIIVNEWLADDLNLSVGDSIVLEYFIVGPLRELETGKETFIVSAVKKISGLYGDPGLMPDLPGLSDAGNCRDWETGVPVDLAEIRDKDEKYWKDYRGIPKAFISIEKAGELWGNRFGDYTSFRLHNPPGSNKEDLLTSIPLPPPAGLGFRIDNVRESGEYAAANGVDFSQLFGGLSFFLLAGAVILTILLYLFNLESRREQLITLSSLGIPEARIRNLVLSEGMVVSVLGSLPGLILSYFYTKLVFLALNSIWKDIIRTDVMMIEIRPLSLATGVVITLFISFFSLFFTLKKYLAGSLQKGKSSAKTSVTYKAGKLCKRLSILSFLIAIILVGWQLLMNESVNESLFFPAGGLLLASGITWFYCLLKSERTISSFSPGIYHVAWRNLYRDPVRSLMVVILFSIGSFLVLTTGSNKKDLFRNADALGSGTGGFLFYGESTVPVLKKLGDPGVRFEYGLEGNYEFVQFRRTEGDDASCLNLNRISNPAIIATNPAALSGRFSFVTSTEFLDTEDPWASLDKNPGDNLIPAIADETVIKWGLGLEVGDTLKYINSTGGEIKLLLVGGLAPSIFQGNVIISERNFIREFPESSGTNIFLIEGNPADSALIISETNRGLRDFGWEMELCAARLAEFSSVTNTYLSIFMVLGALGLLLGTIGLAVVLLRSALERKQEIALLRAVGYSINSIRKQYLYEYSYLLIIGSVIGLISSVIATFPSLVSHNTGASIKGILVIMVILLINGILWIAAMCRLGVSEKYIYESLRND